MPVEQHNVTRAEIDELAVRASLRFPSRVLHVVFLRALAHAGCRARALVEVFVAAKRIVDAKVDAVTNGCDCNPARLTTVEMRVI